MNEYIEIRLRGNGRVQRIKRQVPRGIEVDEPDPIGRTVYIEFAPADPISKFRMQRVRQVQGWEPSVFKLQITVEDGSLILRGVDRHSLPEGRYNVQVRIEHAKTKAAKRSVSVPHDGFGVLDVDVTIDDRSVEVDLDDCDADVQRVLAASSIGGWSPSGGSMPR